MIHPTIRTFTYSLAISLLFACNQQTIQNGQIDTGHIREIFVDTTNTAEKVSTLVDHISYIKLGKSPLPITKIDRIKISGNKVFVLDNRISNSIFVFDTTGNFLYNIGGSGNPLPVVDFCLTPAGKLYAYSAARHKIIGYNVETGDKEDEIRIDGYFHEIAMLNDATFVLLRDGVSYFDADPVKYDQNRICLFNTAGKYLKGYLQHPLFPYINYGSMHARYSQAMGAIKISRLYSDTVYTLTDKGLEASYQLDLVNSFPNAGFFQARDYKAADAFARRDQFASIWGPFFETGNHIAFYYTRKGRVNFCWIDKRSKKQMDIPYFINDIDQLPDIGSIAAVEEDKIISVLPAIQLLNAHTALSRTNDFQQHHQALITIAEGLTNTSNPVISVQHLRNNATAGL